jgi:hypothetical protein
MEEFVYVMLIKLVGKKVFGKSTAHRSLDPKIAVGFGVWLMKYRIVWRPFSKVKSPSTTRFASNRIPGQG